MRSVRVELERLRARPTVLGLLAVGLLLTGILVVSAAYGTRPVTSTERATAEQLLQQQQEANSGSLRACLRDPSAFFGSAATETDCEANQPTLDWFLPRPTLDLAVESQGRGTVVVLLLAGLAVVAGATFAGADWGNRSISNQLLFQPRRLRLWAAKAVAVTVGCALAGAIVLAAFWGSLAALAAQRGIPVSAETWTLVGETAGRGLALVAAVALGGFALTMLLRHTVGTLGLLFAYAVVGEGLAASLPVARMSQWSLSKNVLAWIQDGVEVFDRSICEPSAPCTPYLLSLEHAAAYLGVLLALAVLASVVSFRQRDVV